MKYWHIFITTVVTISHVSVAKAGTFKCFFEKIVGGNIEPLQEKTLTLAKGAYEVVSLGTIGDTAFNVILTAEEQDGGCCYRSNSRLSKSKVEMFYEMKIVDGDGFIRAGTSWHNHEGGYIYFYPNVGKADQLSVSCRR